MSIPKEWPVEMITPQECESVIQDISRTIRKPIDCVSRKSALVAVLDDTIMNVWPGPEVNMRFPWNEDHPIDSIKYSCSDRSGRFEIGHVVLRDSRMSYFELKETLMLALIGKPSGFN